MSRVVVIGSINNDIVVSAERHPHPGETVSGTGLAQFPGGKGANQAVASARAGATTALVAAVGDDDAGGRLVVFLREAQIDLSNVAVRADEPTGTALITVAGGENSIVVVPGANGTLGVDSLDRFEIGATDVVVAQFETPVDTTLEAFRRARAAGAETLLNPAPMAAVPDELLEVTSILVVNEHEFAELFAVPVERLLAATDPHTIVASAAFSGVVVVTLGAAGVVIATGSELERIDGRSAVAVDSTGAGDCFVGYLAAGVSAGRSLVDATQLANAAAALSVTRHGAAASIPFASELS